MMSVLVETSSSSEEIELEELVNLHAAIRQGDPEADGMETGIRDGGDGWWRCVRVWNPQKCGNGWKWGKMTLIGQEEWEYMGINVKHNYLEVETQHRSDKRGELTLPTHLWAQFGEVWAPSLAKIHIFQNWSVPRLLRLSGLITFI